MIQMTIFDKNHKNGQVAQVFASKRPWLPEAGDNPRLWYT